jgi:hypothetical protein
VSPPYISGVIMGLNLILQTILVGTFGFSIGGALVGDIYLTAIGLITSLGCVMVLMARGDE